MTASISVDVPALKALQKALRQIDNELAKTLRRELKSAAGIVASDAKSRVPGGGTGRHAASIRAGSTARGAYVAGGKATVKSYGWLDFGSRTPISGRARSVGPWAGSGKGPRKGRFIYPALDAKREVVTDAVRKATSKAIDAAGF